MSYIHKKVSSKDQVMNINEIAAMTLGIEMVLNGLDIGFPVTMTLDTTTITNNCLSPPRNNFNLCL